MPVAGGHGRVRRPGGQEGASPRPPLAGTHTPRQSHCSCSNQLTHAPIACLPPQCGVCSKAFLTEDALDKHLGSRHGALAPPGADVCLADFCDVLQCDVYEASTRGVVSLAHPLPVAARPCGSRERELAKHKCDTLLRLCLPLHSQVGGNASRAAARQAAAYDRLVVSHCGMLKCEAVHDLFASAVFAARLWTGLKRVVTVGVTLVVVVYYIGIAREVIRTALGGGGSGGGGRSTGQGVRAGSRCGSGFGGLLPKEELPRRVAAFLLGGKLGVRLAFGQVLWSLGQRYWRRLQKQQRKKRA